MASRLRADIEIGIHSACWIFAVAKKLIDEAERNEMKTIVKKINGGYLGIEERMES
jgi:putative chitinase